MSRIFDALQMSKSEGDGLGFPVLTSSTAEVPLPTEVETGDLAGNDFAQFPSLAISASPNSRLVSLTDEASLGAEKFRFLGVRLRQIQQARPLKRLLITSTIPEEGKTMVSANLAISLALRRSQRVLLLEGDLRRPALSGRFGLGKLSGLSECLQGKQDAARCIHHVEGAGFWLLTAGNAPANPLELLQSERLTALMDQLTNWFFDWILVDSPPVVPLADTSIWMRSADGILMVAREGKSQKRQLQRGLQALEQSKFLGVVLNSSTSTDHENYYQRYGAPSAP
jgi:capsular exopolysaccharide synthesis family protein